MTCRSCVRYKECGDPSKSVRYEEDGDSYANRCDRFESALDSRLGMDGYEAVKVGKIVRIYDVESGHIVARFSTNKRASKKLLQDMIENYKAWLKAHRKIRVVDIDEEEIMREYEADGRQGKF